LREPSPTIEQLSREVRISPFHRIRQFQAVFGVTPRQFRITSRIELAKQLIAHGEHSVTDVCMEIGFSSLGSFRILFAQRVAQTPSAYRRRVRMLISVPGRGPSDARMPELMAPLPRAR
jgi:AraC-like DNA-binding protein